jgi:hypothetical protein
MKQQHVMQYEIQDVMQFGNSGGNSKTRATAERPGTAKLSQVVILAVF